jgi:hypothetical protein
MKKIKLTKGKFAIVDDEDYEFISRLPIKLSNGGEIVARFENNKNKFSIPVSFILLRPVGMLQPIFKNKNKLDIRKENMFLVSQSQLNHGIRINYKNTKKTSKYRGVSFKKNCNLCWFAQIMHNKKSYSARFKKENEAGLWYNRKAVELFGELAYQNKI